MKVGQMFVTTAVAVLTIVVFSFHAVYPSIVAVFQFLGYVFIFNLFPGLIITRLLLPRAKEAAVYFCFALGIGVVVNVFLMTILWSVGHLHWMAMLPVVA